MNSKKQFLDYIGEVKNIISTLEISGNMLLRKLPFHFRFQITNYRKFKGILRMQS